MDDSLLERILKIGDVVIGVRAELDRTTIQFNELLALDVDSLIQLPRPTGENITIYAEDVLIGWGEVLLMDGVLTVRLADLRNAFLPGSHEEEAASSASVA